MTSPQLPIVAWQAIGARGPYGEFSVGKKIGPCRPLTDHAAATEALRVANERIAELESKLQEPAILRPDSDDAQGLAAPPGWWKGFKTAEAMCADTLMAALARTEAAEARASQLRDVLTELVAGNEADAAWSARDLKCGCDYNESCLRCFPAEFRRGGKYHELRARPLAGEAARAALKQSEPLKQTGLISEGDRKGREGSA